MVAKQTEHRDGGCCTWLTFQRAGQKRDRSSSREDSNSELSHSVLSRDSEASRVPDKTTAAEDTVQARCGEEFSTQPEACFLQGTLTCMAVALWEPPSQRAKLPSGKGYNPGAFTHRSGNILHRQWNSKGRQSQIRGPQAEEEEVDVLSDSEQHKI